MPNPLVSVITCACQQGDWVRHTVPQIKKSLAGWPAEIIVVDDQSTDGCCHGLDRDVLILRTEKRYGVSGSRRLAVKHSQGDVLLFTDPHCDYPEGALRDLVKTATDKQAIVQPATVSLPEDKRTRLGGKLVTSERGLRVKRCRKQLAEWPALLGTIYVVQRPLYDFLGGWPQLPGVWGYSEQALSLMAWYAGVPIYVDARHVCNHQNYHPDGSFAYSVHLKEQAANGHFVHAAFFPQTYIIYWREVLRNKFGLKLDHEECLEGHNYRRFCKHIQQRAVRTEKDFFEMVLETAMPTPADESFVNQQRTKSKPQDTRVGARIDAAIEWCCRNIPGCLRGRSILDLGSREGYCVMNLKKRGARHVEGIEIVPEVADWAKKNGRPVRHGDMRAIPDSSDTWDVVTALHSFEHIPDPWRARDEMIRVLRPGGWGFLVVPVEDSPVIRHAHNYAWPNEDSFKSFVLENKHVKAESLKTKIGKLARGKREIRLLFQKAK